MSIKIFRIRNETARESLAEFLGTFTLVCIGCSANALITLSSPMVASFLAAAIAWGMALVCGIYVSGGVSGGHCNPGVSLGMASIGKLPWGKLLHYLIAQYFGAFIGAFVTYIVYNEAIKQKFGETFQVFGVNATAGIFGTFPNEQISILSCFVDQVVGSAFFLLLINAITDKRNMNCPKGLVPIAIGFIDLTLMILAFGYNSGAPINPARDFSPRLLSFLVGYGPEVFSVRNYGYFWLSLIACNIGSVLGSWIYKIFIENHWPESDYDDNDGNLNDLKELRYLDK